MKILLVQTSFLGDTILSTPLISGIKALYPDADLWVMTTPLASKLVVRDPLVSGVLAYDKRGKESGLSGLLRMRHRIRAIAFDRVYSLHRSFRTSILLWLCGIPVRIGCENARLSFLYHKTRKRNAKDHNVIRDLSLLSGEVPIESLETDLRLFAPARNELDKETISSLPQPGGYVVLVPGSAWETKMWDWRGYRKVARFLLRRGLDVVLLGGPMDTEVSAKVAWGTEVIDLTGKTDIAETMYIVKNARLIVCNDSMALHMASGFKVPNVAIFCATSPRFGFGPWKNRAVVVEKKDLACRPCRRHGGRSCPTGTEACMKDLSPDEVIGAIKSLLDIE